MGIFKSILITLSTSCLLLGLPVQAQQVEEVTEENRDHWQILHAGTLLAVPGEQPMGNATLVIKNDRIDQLLEGFQSAEQLGLDQAEVIDLRDKFVLPGLIDAHVHLTKDRSIGKKPDESKDVYALALGVQNARKTVEAGFTTVRNLGSSAWVSGTRSAQDAALYYEKIINVPTDDDPLTSSAPSSLHFWNGLLAHIPSIWDFGSSNTANIMTMTRSIYRYEQLDTSKRSPDERPILLGVVALDMNLRTLKDALDAVSENLGRTSFPILVTPHGSTIYHPLMNEYKKRDLIDINLDISHFEYFKHIDEDNEIYYYYNLQTCESVWDPPLTFQMCAWQIEVDEHDAVFYSNETLGRTSWTVGDTQEGFNMENPMM
jgi:hypothetical protein